MFLRAAPSTAMRIRVAPTMASSRVAVCADLTTLRRTTPLSDALVSAQPASISTVKLAPNTGLVSWVTMTVIS